jgi:hypothetical protein
MKELDCVPSAFGAYEENTERGSVGNIHFSDRIKFIVSQCSTHTYFFMAFHAVVCLRIIRVCALME